MVLIALMLAGILLLWQLSWLILRALSWALPRLVRGPMAAHVWARTHSLRAVFSTRFPGTYAALSARLTPRRFAGLPLTLMVMAALYIAALLGGLIDELFEAEELLRFDAAVDDAVDASRTRVPVALFAWITQLGDNASLTAVALVATALFWAHRRAWMIPSLWLTIAGSQATTWLGKYGFDRARPEFITEVTAITPAFPSGHASAAAAVFGFLAYAVARDLPGLRGRFEVVFWSLVVIGLIGFSRIFLGVHYASDVAAGLLVGLFWLLAGFALAEHLRQKE